MGQALTNHRGDFSHVNTTRRAETDKKRNEDDNESVRECVLSTWPQVFVSQKTRK